MTEYTRPSWAEGVGANVTAPSALILDQGYPAGAKLPASEFNWALKELFRGGASYASVADGLDAVPEGGTFSVSHRAGCKLGDEIDSVLADVGPILCTDGRYIYAAGVINDVRVTCYDTRTLVEVWHVTMDYNITSIFVYGSTLYVALQAEALEPTVISLDSSDGSILFEYVRGVDDSYPSCVCANASGVYFSNAEGDGFVWFLSTSLVYVGLFNYRAEVFSICCDECSVYATGAACGAGGPAGMEGKQLVRISLSRGYLGSVAIDAGDSFAFVSVDDEAVYVITKGGDEFSYAFGKVSLDNYWLTPSISHNISDSAFPVVSDDGMLMVAGGVARRLTIIGKSVGSFKFVLTSSTDLFDAIVTDGMFIYAAGKHAGVGTPTFLGKYAYQTHPRIFGHCNGSMLARPA